MRIAMTAACSAALLLAGAPAALATSLSGAPFKLVPDAASPQVAVSAFNNKDGGFGAVIAEDVNGDQTPETIYLQLFDAKGKRNGKKGLVFETAPTPFPAPASATPGGGLPIAGGKTLVGYTDMTFAMSGPVGGFRGQVMSKGKKSGKQVDLDDSASTTFAYGYLQRLSDGRGLAYWSALDLQQKNEAGARFVTQAGDPMPATINLTRKNSLFSGATPFMDGFIVQHAQYDKKFTKASVFARVYDGAGKPKGAEATLEDNGKFDDAVFTSAVGLTNGQVVVLRSVATAKGADISAQLYDGVLKPAGQPKVLAKGAIDQTYAVHPLAGGDFIFGAKVKDGAKDVALEYSRFSPKLKPVGAPARIAGVAKPDFMQLVELDGGNVVAIYTSKGADPTGQVIKP